MLIDSNYQLSIENHFVKKNSSFFSKIVTPLRCSYFKSDWIRNLGNFEIETMKDANHSNDSSE